MLVCASTTTHAHGTAGASGARHSLRPLIGEGGKLMANLGHGMPRDRGGVFGHSSSLRKQGPITTVVSGCARIVEQRLSNQTARRMGSCFRRNDKGFTPSSPVARAGGRNRARRNPGRSRQCRGGWRGCGENVR